MTVLIKILQDGQFHSGEELGAALGISRAGVWKQLQRLEAEYGLLVHRVKGRGYQLASPLSMLDEQRLEVLKPVWPVHLFENLPSTNLRAQELIAQGVRPPFVVSAERQTAGRGRRGREWVSPYAQNLYFSVAMPVEGGLRQLEGIPLVVGLAVFRVLEQYSLPALGLKWPNDVLVGAKKIVGILLELTGDPADRSNLVIGVGVNVNMSVVEGIGQPWTSLLNELSVRVDRTELLVRLLASLQQYLEQHARFGFEALREEWQQCHLWQGRQAVLSAGDRRIEGVVTGVDAGGALRMEVDGKEQLFSGGELSLRLADDS